MKWIRGTAIIGACVFASASFAGAASSSSVSVSATVLSKNVCHFNTAALTLNFGALNPTSPVAVSTSGTLVFRCNGSSPTATFVVTSDDGMYETGPGGNRMRHATNPAAHIAYSLSVNPTTATIPRNTNTNMTVTASIAGIAYQTAIPGDYSDTVVLSIVP